MRVVFMGSDAIALPALRSLCEPVAGAEVVGVFTQPDRPSGRGMKAEPNAIKRWAVERGLEVRQPERIGPADHDALTALRPDVSLVMAYGHILRDAFIGIPALGTLNLHASILPRYRGASPIQSAIASGERETGVTLMRIVRELDAGPVADIERVPIGAEDTAAEVAGRLGEACAPLLRRALPQLAQGKLPFEDQDAGEASYCRRLEKADGVLDFRTGARLLAARINGLMPWPGCAVGIRGESVRFGLATAETVADGAGAKPGMVVAAGAVLAIATGDGRLLVHRLQRPGGRMLAAADFLRGFPLEPGTVLPSLPMPPLVSTQPFKH